MKKEYKSSNLDKKLITIAKNMGSPVLFHVGVENSEIKILNAEIVVVDEDEENPKNEALANKNIKLNEKPIYFG